MELSISHLHNLNYPVVQGIIPYIKAWMGKTVRWIQAQCPSFSIQEPKAAILTLITANFIFFQLAYRIAHRADPEHNFIEGGLENFHARLGTIFVLTYGLGLGVLMQTLHVPLSKGSCIALHVATFVGSLLFTHI